MFLYDGNNKTIFELKDETYKMIDKSGADCDSYYIGTTHWVFKPKYPAASSTTVEFNATKVDSFIFSVEDVENNPERFMKIKDDTELQNLSDFLQEKSPDDKFIRIRHSLFGISHD